MKVVCTPGFVREAWVQAGPVREGLSKLLRVAMELEAAALLNHQGVHLEKLAGKVDPASRKPLYSLRATRSARVIAILDGDALVPLTVVADHDKAYR